MCECVELLSCVKRCERIGKLTSCLFRGLENRTHFAERNVVFGEACNARKRAPAPVAGEGDEGQQIAHFTSLEDVTEIKRGHAFRFKRSGKFDELRVFTTDNGLRAKGHAALLS